MTLRDDREAAEVPHRTSTGPSASRAALHRGGRGGGPAGAEEGKRRGSSARPPRAKQLYQPALRDIEGGKFDAGLRNLKLAASFEPANAKFKEKIAEVEAAMKAAAKAKKR